MRFQTNTAVMQTQKCEKISLIAHLVILIGTRKQMLFTVLMLNGNVYNKFYFISEIFLMSPYL